MFFSISAMAFVTEIWTAVMCWKTKQSCNKMAIFVCIMQVHFGSLECVLETEGGFWVFFEVSQKPVLKVGYVELLCSIGESHWNWVEFVNYRSVIYPLEFFDLKMFLFKMNEDWFHCVGSIFGGSELVSRRIFLIKRVGNWTFPKSTWASMPIQEHGTALLDVYS